MSQWESITRTFKRNNKFFHEGFRTSPYKRLNFRVVDTSNQTFPISDFSYSEKPQPSNQVNTRSNNTERCPAMFNRPSLEKLLVRVQPWQSIWLLVSLVRMMMNESVHAKEDNSFSDLDFPSIRRAQRAISCASQVNNRFRSVLIFHYLIKWINLIQYLASSRLKPSSKKLNTHALTSVNEDKYRPLRLAHTQAAMNYFSKQK